MVELPEQAYVVLGVIVAMALHLAWRIRRRRRDPVADPEYDDKQVMFSRGYPDLSPDLHPSRVLAYALAQYGHGVPVPEFAAARAGQFRFRKTAKGAELRVGNGRFDIILGNPAMPKVHYVDRDREFTWYRTLMGHEEFRFYRGPWEMPAHVDREKTTY